MKGNKMSAILAILLMLGGGLFAGVAFVPFAHAQPTISVVPASVTKQHLTFAYPDSITVGIEVSGVTNLFAFQVGFYFNATVLAVTNVVEGGFLSKAASPGTLEAYPALTPPPYNITNDPSGIVPYYGWSEKAGETPASGTGFLMNVTLQVESTAPSWSGAFPGSPIQDVGIVVETGPAATILLDPSLNDITPPESSVTNGTFTLQVVPVAPIAGYVVTSAPPYYTATPISFDASSSKAGSDGVTPYDSPIITYYWNWGDGSYSVASSNFLPSNLSALATHSYAAVGSYTVSLIVEDVLLTNSTAFVAVVMPITVSVRPTGCIVDVFTQFWRYADPFEWPTVYAGKGWNTTADMFRPGDQVQLFVTTSYNGDPVSAQMVTVEVFDNNNNIVAVGQFSATNATGCGEYEFRIPWPEPSPIGEFGMWHASVTWEIGQESGIPYAKTQNDTVWWYVGWGVSSEDLVVTPALGVNTLPPNNVLTIKYTLVNDYFEAVPYLTTAVAYDVLDVPVGMATQSGMISPGTLPVTLTITIPVWTFVGTGTVKADEFTTYPNLLGIVWGPEQVTNFIVLHTVTPSN